MLRTFFLSLLFVGIAGLHASPVGNPAFPQLIQEGFFIPCTSWAGLRLGYEGDFVTNALLVQKRSGSGRVDGYSQDTNSGTVTINFVDRMDIYGVFGSSRTCANWRFSMEESVHRVGLESRCQFLGAIGARGILYEWGCAYLGIGGRYSRTNPKPSWITIDGAPISTKGSSMRWSEWQIDLDIAYKIDLLVPYIGVKYAKQFAKVVTASLPISNSGLKFLSMQSRQPLGMVVGCTLTTGKYFMLNVEGRLIDEQAVTISGDIRF